MGALAIPQIGQPPGTYNYPSSAYNPMNARDVYNMYGGLGQSYFDWGQSFGTQQGALANYYGGNEAGYGNLTNQLYSPIWQGGGGYTPEQMQNVLQSQGLQDVLAQSPNNFLSQ